MPLNKQPAGPMVVRPVAPMAPGAMMPNPVLAQTAARTLQASGQLARYHINVAAHGGTVDLYGEIADENQREIVIRLLRTVPGIVTVRDWIQVRPDRSVVAVQAPVLAPILPLPLMQPPPDNQGQQGKQPERIDGQLPEPTPIFQAAPAGQPNATMQPPPLPPYAWPTFAPYNNYSRVAYPTAYPYEQWPFIGPFYPFPRVPLGWRSVSLTWEDGHWWFHRNPTGHDWWRVRYR